jgi:Secretion system C-terminal sorting domain
MKKKLHLFLFFILTLFNSNLLAQCTDSGKPIWSPVPGVNSASGTFNYPSTAAKGTIAVSPNGSNAYNDPSTTSLVTNMAFFTKQGLQTVVFTFNTVLSKATTLTPTNVIGVSTNESFRLSSVGTTEGQIVSATDISGIVVYPIWANSSNVAFSGVNNNEITGTGSTGASEFSFAVPIKTLTIAPKSGVIASSGLNVILQPVCAAASLPVELTFFRAKQSNDIVKLTWQTASEKNNKSFEILRSIDAKTWVNIGLVKGQGSSDVITNYIFEDNYPLSILTYYRLKQVDFDGKETYSNIESVSLKNTQKGFKIYPNPIENKIATIDLNEDMIGGSIHILNSMGSVLKSQPIHNQSITLDLLSLPVGLYVVKAQKNSVLFLEKIMITN